VLFIDKMGALAKFASRGSLQDLEREYRRAQERGEIASDPQLTQELNELEVLA